MAKKSITTMKYDLSDELEVIVGNGPMTRPQVVKKLWEYIKEYDLQDERNKRMICPDDDLAEVLGAKPIDMLKMQAKLSPHLLKRD